MTASGTGFCLGSGYKKEKKIKKILKVEAELRYYYSDEVAVIFFIYIKISTYEYRVKNSFVFSIIIFKFFSFFSLICLIFICTLWIDFACHLEKLCIFMLKLS